MDSTNKLSAEAFGIYAAANKLVAQIGMIGAVDSSDPAVEDCMAALHALDGGNVARRVEDLTEKAFMPHNQASRLAVDEYIAIASAISPQLVASECRPTLAEFGALRQFKHNDGSDGFVAAYDKEATDLYISSFAAPQVVADERKGSPYPDYDRGFSNGWDACAKRAAAPVQAQEPIGYAPTYLTERMAAGDSAVMLTVTRKPLPGHGVTVALYTAPVQPVAVPDGKYGRLTGDNIAQPVQMKVETK